VQQRSSAPDAPLLARDGSHDAARGGAVAVAPPRVVRRGAWLLATSLRVREWCTHAAADTLRVSRARGAQQAPQARCVVGVPPLAAPPRCATTRLCACTRRCLRCQALTRYVCVCCCVCARRRARRAARLRVRTAASATPPPPQARTTAAHACATCLRTRLTRLRAAPQDDDAEASVEAMERRFRAYDPKPTATREPMRSDNFPAPKPKKAAVVPITERVQGKERACVRRETAGEAVPAARPCQSVALTLRCHIFAAALFAPRAQRLRLRGRCGPARRASCGGPAKSCAPHPAAARRLHHTPKTLTRSTTAFPCVTCSPLLTRQAYAMCFVLIGGWILFRFVGPAVGLYTLKSGLTDIPGGR
jgi:hypothetical protein